MNSKLCCPRSTTYFPRSRNRKPNPLLGGSLATSVKSMLLGDMPVSGGLDTIVLMSTLHAFTGSRSNRMVSGDERLYSPFPMCCPCPPGITTSFFGPLGVAGSAGISASCIFCCCMAKDVAPSGFPVFFSDAKPVSFSTTTYQFCMSV